MECKLCTTKMYNDKNLSCKTWKHNFKYFCCQITEINFRKMNNTNKLTETSVNKALRQNGSSDDNDN